MIEVTVIIPNWNGARWLPSCLDALVEQTFQDFRLLVIDNGSTDRSLEIIRSHPIAVEISTLDKNYGFARAVNLGIQSTESPYVVLLNTDTVPEPEWLNSLVNAMRGSPKSLYAVGSLMLNMENPRLIDDAGNDLSWYGLATKRLHGRNLSSVNVGTQVFSVSAGAAIYRRSCFGKIGYFDELFGSYLEDVDLGLRAKIAGMECIIEPTALIRHHGHGSDLSHRRYIALITCNRLLLFYKNFPLSILLSKIWRILSGQLYFLIAYGQPIASLRGYWKFLKKVPRIERTPVSQTGVDLGHLLSDLPPDPPLSHFLRGYWKSFVRIFGIS